MPTSDGAAAHQRHDRTTVDFAIERVDADDPMQTSTRCSLVGFPPAEKLRLQIEAG